jgi:hypothetical protein
VQRRLDFKNDACHGFFDFDAKIIADSIGKNLRNAVKFFDLQDAKWHFTGCF